MRACATTPQAKARIFFGNGAQVINRGDAWAREMVGSGRRIFTFGLDEPREEGAWGLRDLDGELWLAEGRANLMKVSELKVTGLHNAANALAALALCRAVGLPYEPLLDALFEFQRAAAPCSAGCGNKRRGFLRRFQGHQRGRYGRRARGYGPQSGAHRRRRRQRPGFLAASGGGCAARPCGGVDRARPRQDRRRASNPREWCWCAPPTCTTRCAQAIPWRTPGTRCCCRRRAPASTCFATTSIARRCSSTRCRALEANAMNGVLGHVG